MSTTLHMATDHMMNRSTVQDEYIHEGRTNLIPQCSRGNRCDIPECCDVLSVPHGWVQRPGEGNVHVEPHPLVDPALVRCAGAREEVAVVVAMHRDVEHAGVGVEDLLCRVAVVNVPVNNEDLLHLMTIQ